ncbi:MAG: Trk system potassium transporter TrkA [Lachnospiraceae bacterium]|nr:Trk system potassium transporter TrkA [Lachnospiraceae bacterium]
MDIIIAGCGKLGSTIASNLSAAGYDLTLIDNDDTVLDHAIEVYDSIAIRGNCATLSVLHDAKVQSADLLIATTNSDELNLLCCMTARSINPNIHTIARIRNPEYHAQTYEMREAFGLSLMVNPERKAAKTIHKLIQLPGFLKRESFAKDRVEIVEIKIDHESILKDVPLTNLYKIVKCKVLVCVILREGEVITPDGSTILKENDRIFVTAQTNNLSLLLKNLGVISKRSGRVMLIGGGNISLYLAQELIKSNIKVEIIEQDATRCEELAGLLPEADIIHADASKHSTLESEGLSECDTIVSLTGMDELNIITSLYAAEHNVPQVITKVGYSDDYGILDKLPIGSIVCPKELSCNSIVRYVRAMSNNEGAAVSVHTIADGLAEAVEFKVDENTENLGVPLKKLKLKKGIIVACITHQEIPTIPNGDSYFEKGDSIILITKSDRIVLNLNDIFG